MGCFFSKCTRSDESKIEIVDLTPPGAEFDYLRPNGTISFSFDRKYNIPVVEINFEGWYENSLHLWPYHTEQREHFLQLQRTQLQTPSNNSDDSGYDTVF